MAENFASSQIQLFVRYSQLRRNATADGGSISRAGGDERGEAQISPVHSKIAATLYDASKFRERLTATDAR